MAWQIVEQTEDRSTADTFVSNPRPPKSDPYSHGYFGPPPPRAPERSSKVLGHSTWRCSHCRALAVTRKGDKPGGKCGKCHL